MSEKPETNTFSGFTRRDFVKAQPSWLGAPY